MNNLRKFLMLLGACIAIQMHAYDFKFYLEDTPITPGADDATLAICFDTDCSQIVGIQFNILLPEGVSINQDDGDYIFDWNPTRIKRNTHIITSRVQTDGSVMVMGFSMTNELFKGTEGDFIYMELSVSDNFKGTKPVYFKNCHISVKDPDGGPNIDIAPDDMVSTIVSTVPDDEPEPSISAKYKTMYISPGDDVTLEATEAQIVENDNDAITLTGTNLHAESCGIAWVKTTESENETWYMVMVCPKVSIAMPEGTEYVHTHAIYGEPMTVKFNPVSGWTLNNLRHNGEDVTSQLGSDLSYTIPVLSDDTNLSLSLEETKSPTTGVDRPINPSGIKVWCENMRVHVEGASQGATVVFNNLKGEEVARTTEAVYGLSQPGIYVVSVDGYRFKVEVR